jgi:hypothetical protein
VATPPTTHGRTRNRTTACETVFLIGMRLNRPWKLHHWWPVLAGMRRMLAELARHPEPGLLGAGTGVLHGGPAVVQYWRGFEHLERFARDPAPCPGWGWPPPAGTCPSPSGASRRPSGSAPSRTTRWRPRLQLGHAARQGRWSAYAANRCADGPGGFARRQSGRRSCAPGSRQAPRAGGRRVDERPGVPAYAAAAVP